MNIFQKGAFSYDPNMTPQQLADKRAMLAILQPKYGKASYIGEGLGQLATGVATGIRTRKLDEIEGKGREQGANLFSGLFGNATQSTSGQSGPMNILGVDPGYGGASSAPPGSPGHTANDGHDHSDWLKYTNQGATRNQPIKPELVSAMSFLPELGLTMEVYSGGQPGIGEGGARVGSTRHDHGGAADVIFRDATGRMLDWNNPDDLPVLTEIVRRAKAAGVTGIGAGDDYMGAGRMHIGFGDPGVWGAGGKGANAPDWLRAAYEGGGLPGGPVAAPAGASMATNSAMPFIDPQALAAALANPWLSPEERSVLTTIYDQQVQAGDPLRQIEVAKGMAELEKMNAPPAPPEDFTTRIFLAQQAGLEPGSEAFQTYLLTGKLPDEVGSNVPAAFASLDLQAKAAGFEPGTPEYQEFMRNGGGSGTPAAFTALDLQAKAAGFEPGTPQYQEFMATRGAGFIAAAKAKGEDAATAESLESKMPGLEEVVQKLDELSEKATYTYGGQAWDWSRKQLGMDPREAAVARSEYIAMVDNQVLPLLRDTFGAQFTQKEGETLRAALGDPNKSPPEKQAVLKAFIEQKRRDLEALNVRTGGGTTRKRYNPATGAFE